MSSYADASAAVNGEDTGSGYGLCCARGCTLPGVLSTSTQGPQQWYCRVHFGTPRADWDSITAHIANRRELFDLAYVLINGQKRANASSATRDRIRAMGRADLASGPAKTEYALGSEILQVIGRECRAPQQHMGVPKSSGTTWLDATQQEEIDT